MKLLYISVIVCLLGSTGLAMAVDSPPPVKETKEGSGIYYQSSYSMGSIGLDYQVDTITRLCFAYFSDSAGYEHSGYASGGLTRIPCKALARRKEWRPILTWIKTTATRRHAHEKH